MTEKPDNTEEAVALTDGRDMCGETVMGMRVAAYREPIRCPADVDPAAFEEFFRRGKPNTYSEHWSTPGKGAVVERLFLEADVRTSLTRRDERIAELEGEARAWLKQHEIAVRDGAAHHERALQAEARLAEAVGALEPFAAFGGKLADYEQFSGKSTTTQWAEHFRRARQALSSIKGEG